MSAAPRRLAIVTGGSRGLGAALCGALLDGGWKVAQTSRTLGDGPMSREPMRDGWVRFDLSRPGPVSVQLDAMMGSLAELPWDELLLVSNAGALAPIGPLAFSGPDDWIANLNVNLVSAVVAMGLFMKRFRERSAPKTIVQISSGAARKGYDGWSLYCAAKAGVENFLEAAALEQARARYPFALMSVDPGIVDTEMQAAIRSTPEARFPDRERFVRYHEQGALQPPEQVAAKILAALAQAEPGALRRVDVG